MTTTTTEQPPRFASAWEQIGAPDATGAFPVTGIDGAAYVARQETRRGQEEWTIARADDHGPGRVTSAADLKGAVQRLNAFHVGETCIHCHHVHSTRGHFCDACGRRRYASWPWTHPCACHPNGE